MTRLAPLIRPLLAAITCCCLAAALRSPRNCYSGYFQCADGTCIPEHLVCDGDVNCITGNDESNCYAGKDSCFSGYFACANGECIPESLVCDGVFNCVTGSDEANCT